MGAMKTFDPRGTTESADAATPTQIITLGNKEKRIKTHSLGIIRR
jgi:hypothetical protein